MTKIAIDGRIVGTVIAGVFIKHVEVSKHFLRTPPGIAFDIASLKQAEQAGAHYVLIVDKETQKQYCATTHDIRVKGIAFERGYGEQICLPFIHFRSSLEELRAQPAML